MLIRTATIDDLDAVSAMEAACFPAAEAAPREAFAQRLEKYGNHFWLLFDGERLLAFADGFVTDEPDLFDEMYEKAELHNEQGKWQMIFGLNTLPAFRRKGLAGQLLRQIIADAKEQARRGVVLTCKERLIPYYAKFGFADEGVSSKTQHGGAMWHQMRLEF